MKQVVNAAAEEAADLVLADDNFASIVAAVREGRTVYDNIKKVLSWTLPTNAGETMTIIFALLLGITLPVTPIQILWINLTTAVTLGIALAFEPTEDNTMRRPPLAQTATDKRCISLAYGACFHSVSLQRLRHFFVCARPWLLSGVGPNHRGEHVSRDGNIPSVLHSQSLQHIAYLEGHSRHQGRVDDRRSGYLRSVRHHVCTTAAKGIRYGSDPLR